MGINGHQTAHLHDCITHSKTLKPQIHDKLNAQLKLLW